MRLIAGQSRMALDMEVSTLHERLLQAAGDRTYRALGDLTGQHPETVRRYMQGQAPSVEFLAALCTGLGLSADWLLTGRGPAKVADARQHAIKEATPADLLLAIANTLDAMGGRLDRLEVFVQTMEARVRGGSNGHAAAGAERRVEEGGRGAAVVTVVERLDPAAARQRARSVADAVPKRPPPDAG